VCCREAPTGIPVLWLLVLRNKALISFVHVLGGNTLMTIAQGLQFLILARVLGPHEFGLIATTGGVAALLMPFSGAGAANVMVMRASRDASLLPTYFGNALATMLCTSTLLIALATTFVGLLLDHQVSTSLMFLFALSELLAAKTVDICWHVYLALDEVPRTSRLLALHSGSRFLAAAAFALLASEQTASQWVWWALLANVVVALAVLRYTLGTVGRPRFQPRLAIQELGAGLSFAVGLSASSFYTDADKIFLARYAGSEIVGQYTMAFRVVQLVLTPIRSLFFSQQAEWYRAGAAGLEGAIAVVKRVALPLLAGAFALGVGFYFAAPLLTVFAGEHYRGSVHILQTQWFLPTVLALQSMLGATLATSGYQRAAATSQIICAGIICVLCVLLIPELGWQGAVISSYASQASLIALMLWCIHKRRDRSEAAQPAAVVSVTPAAPLAKLKHEERSGEVSP
jgi:O-antigen/teichoic acid export membrane protein